MTSSAERMTMDYPVVVEQVPTTNRIVKGIPRKVSPDEIAAMRAAPQLNPDGRQGDTRGSR